MHDAFDRVFIYNQGVIVLTKSSKLIGITNLEDPKVKLLSDLSQCMPLHALCITSNTSTASKQVDIVLCVRDYVTFAHMQHNDEKLLTNGPFYHIAKSPNNRYLALTTSTNRLWIVSSDFRTQLVDFTIKFDNADTTRSFDIYQQKDSLQLEWMGSDCLSILWNKTILCVNLFGESIEFDYSDDVLDDDIFFDF